MPDDPDDERTFGLVLPFDTDDREFCRGVQVGSLWAQAEHRPDAFTMLVYADADEMVARVLERTDRDWHVSEATATEVAEESGQSLHVEDGAWLQVDVGPKIEM